MWLIPDQLRSVCLAESAGSISDGNSQPEPALLQPKYAEPFQERANAD